MKNAAFLRMLGLLVLVLSLTLMASCDLFSDSPAESEEVGTDEATESVTETDSSVPTTRPIVTKEPQTGTTAEPAGTTAPTTTDTEEPDSAQYPGIGEILDWED